MKKTFIYTIVSLAIVLFFAKIYKTNPCSCEEEFYSTVDSLIMDDSASFDNVISPNEYDMFIIRHLGSEYNVDNSVITDNNGKPVDYCKLQSKFE